MTLEMKQVTNCMMLLRASLTLDPRQVLHGFCLIALALGINLHRDGHEKIDTEALNMGGVGLPVHMRKDKFSSFVPIMQVLQNVCL
jgi:hypothetical protein